MKTFLILAPALLLAACDDTKTGTTKGIDDSGGGGIETDPDGDGDGYPASEDCNDDDASVNPGSIEVCDGIDNNCDDTVDEDVTTTYYADTDADGFGDVDVPYEACEKPAGYVPNGNDCDDDEPDAYPGNLEVCDRIDNNCDGDVDEGVANDYYADADNDGFGDPDSRVSACTPPTGYVIDDSDCDDTSADSFPGNPEVCDELDNDCDEAVDEGVTTTYYADMDGDGYGDPAASTEACSLPVGYSAVDTDCDDSDDSANPGETEYCDDIDNDCDGRVDEADAADASTWYADTDSDGFGDVDVSEIACSAPTGYVSDHTDCDDDATATYPGSTEYCNDIDDDCDGTTDETDSADAADWYRDYDSDGYGDPDRTVHQCEAPSGYIEDDTDCDDTYALTYPGADEYCDTRDNDCDGDIDEDGEVVDGDTYYADTDGDGTGDPDVYVIACEPPSGYVDNEYDCDDTTDAEPVVVDAVSGSSAGIGSMDSPLDSLQDGIDRAGQCVIAYAGTYREQVDLSGLDIDVWGVEGADFTYIDPGYSTCGYGDPTTCGAAVVMESGAGASPTLRGFTVTGGSGNYSYSSSSTSCADSDPAADGTATCTINVYEYCGGGIYVDGDDPILEELVIYANILPEFAQVAVGDFEQTWMYSYGGGLCVMGGGNVTATEVDMISNFADQGGAVYIGDGSVNHEQSNVCGNSATDGAGYNVDSSDLVLTNVLVAFNNADTDGGGIFTQSSGTSTVTNVAIGGNTSATSGSTRGDAIYSGSGTTVTVMNSITQANSANYVLYGVGGLASSYTDVYNRSTGGTYGGAASAGTGNITADPSFVSYSDDGNCSNNNWRLNTTSSAVNAGNPDAAYNDADGTVNDMGAYGGPGSDW